MTSFEQPASPPPLRGLRRARTGADRFVRRETLAGYAMILPSLIGVVGFVFVPVLFTFALSFQDWNLISPPRWVGFDNYLDLSQDPGFWNSIWVTAVFTALAIPAMVVCGLLIALGLNRKLPGSRVLQVVYVIPWVSAPLVLGLVWRWMFDPSFGMVNEILGRRVEWLTDMDLALVAVAFVYVWSGVGYVSLFFLAGLQAIPMQLYEAAKIDGAHALTRLTRITLPLLRPTTFFVLVTSTISSFQVFDLIYGMTQGGPANRTEVIAARIYYEAFEFLRFGDAAATAFILFVVLIMITLLQHLYFRRRTTYDIS